MGSRGCGEACKPTRRDVLPPCIPASVFWGHRPPPTGSREAVSLPQDGCDGAGNGRESGADLRARRGEKTPNRAMLDSSGRAIYSKAHWREGPSQFPSRKKLPFSDRLAKALQHKMIPFPNGPFRGVEAIGTTTVPLRRRRRASGAVSRPPAAPISSYRMNQPPFCVSSRRGASRCPPPRKECPARRLLTRQGLPIKVSNSGRV